MFVVWNNKHGGITSRHSELYDAVRMAHKRSKEYANNWLNPISVKWENPCGTVDELGTFDYGEMVEYVEMIDTKVKVC